MFEHLIGKESNKVLNTIEYGAVKKFAHAIGENHPIYIDHEYGIKSRFEGNMVPPTFPVTFDYGSIDGFAISTAGLIHGEQSFDYVRPLIVGESLYCYTKVKNYVEKKTQSGNLGFLTLLNIGEEEDGSPIFNSKIIIILTEKVREGLLNGKNKDV